VKEEKKDLPGVIERKEGNPAISQIGFLCRGGGRGNEGKKAAVREPVLIKSQCNKN